MTLLTVVNAAYLSLAAEYDVTGIICITCTALQGTSAYIDMIYTVSLQMI